MDQWRVNFQTRSRNDVMKVCALLAQGIGNKTLCDERVRIFIRGSFNSGKTAITDGLVAAFSDGMQSYNLPQKSLLEDFQGQAFHDEIFKNFTVGGVQTLCTLGRFDFAVKNRSMFDSFHRVSAFRKPIGGLDFMTTCYREPPDNSDIIIEFNDLRERDIFGPEWERSWSVFVMNQRFQTPDMDFILNHLRAFHERRLGRMQALETLQVEPA